MAFRVLVERLIQFQSTQTETEPKNLFYVLGGGLFLVFFKKIKKKECRLCLYFLTYDVDQIKKKLLVSQRPMKSTCLGFDFLWHFTSNAGCPVLFLKLII